ncbi:MAG TPA: hypothetical protein VIG25_02055 [Pyrinomonadaceae bacterium]|jgi:hypothetical protein
MQILSEKEALMMGISKSLLIGLMIALTFGGCTKKAMAQDQKGRGGSTSKSRAPAKKPVIAVTVDPCAVVAAHASVTLGPGVPGVQAVSDGTKYAPSGPCGFYVVDITVPNNSSASGFLPSFSLESGAVELKKANGENMSNGTNYAGGFAVPNYDTCRVYHQETRVFVRNSNVDEFTLLSSVRASGGIDETTPYQSTKNVSCSPKSRAKGC